MLNFIAPLLPPLCTQGILSIQQLFLDLGCVVFTFTQNEAGHFGTFLRHLMDPLHRWYHDAPAYARECLELYRNGSSLDYEHFCLAFHDWHRLIHEAFLGCLQTVEYMKVRNSIIILDRIQAYYPFLAKHGNQLEEQVKQMLLQEKREDLRVLLTRFDAALQKNRTRWLPDLTTLNAPHPAAFEVFKNLQQPMMDVFAAPRVQHNNSGATGSSATGSSATGSSAAGSKDSALNATSTPSTVIPATRTFPRSTTTAPVLHLPKFVKPRGGEETRSDGAAGAHDHRQQPTEDFSTLQRDLRYTQDGDDETGSLTTEPPSDLRSRSLALEGGRVGVDDVYKSFRMDGSNIDRFDSTSLLRAQENKQQRVTSPHHHHSASPPPPSSNPSYSPRNHHLSASTTKTNLSQPSSLNFVTRSTSIKTRPMASDLKSPKTDYSRDRTRDSNRSEQSFTRPTHASTPQTTSGSASGTAQPKRPASVSLHDYHHADNHHASNDVEDGGKRRKVADSSGGDRRRIPLRSDAKNDGRNSSGDASNWRSNHDGRKSGGLADPSNSLKTSTPSSSVAPTTRSSVSSSTKSTNEQHPSVKHREVSSTHAISYDPEMSKMRETVRSSINSAVASGRMRLDRFFGESPATLAPKKPSTSHGNNLDGPPVTSNHPTNIPATRITATTKHGESGVINAHSLLPKRSSNHQMNPSTTTHPSSSGKSTQDTTKPPFASTSRIQPREESRRVGGRFVHGAARFDPNNSLPNPPTSNPPPLHTQTRSSERRVDIADGGRIGSVDRNQRYPDGERRRRDEPQQLPRYRR